MLVEAAGQATTAAQLGAWLGASLFILVGVILFSIGRRQRSESRGARGRHKVGWGLVLAIVGIGMTVVQFIGGHDVETDRAGETAHAVSGLDLGRARDITLSRPFRVELSSPDVELKVSFAGDDSTGVNTVNGATIRFVQVGGDFYLRGNEAFWKSIVADDAGTVTERIGSRWLLLDPDGPVMEALAGIGDKSETVRDVFPKNGVGYRADLTKVRGINCYKIDGAQGSAMYVQTGTLQLIRTVDDQGHVADFYYDAVVVPKAPRRVVQQRDILAPA